MLSYRIGKIAAAFMGQKQNKERNMKTTKLALVTALLCAAALLASTSLVRAEDAKTEKKPCCEATVEAGAKCAHECCVTASKAGKVCEKCHPKKDEKK